MIQAIQKLLDFEARQKAAGKLILLTEGGSRAYGTHRPDSDHDFRGVYMASPAKMLSLSGAPQTLRLGEHDTEVDVVAWELLHFCKLAAAANPTILELLWADTYVASQLGEALRESRDLFLSKQIVKTYGGYALQQLKAAKAGTGGSRGVSHYKREKFKLHTLRLLLAGRHALETGEVLVRLNAGQVAWLRAAASLPIETFESHVKTRTRALDTAAETSKLPERADREAIDKLMATLRGVQ